MASCRRTSRSRCRNGAQRSSGNADAACECGSMRCERTRVRRRVARNRRGSSRKARMRTLLLPTLLALSCVVWPAVAAAQTSTIAGTVQDESGAALPGVSVEVASPALIEKVRMTMTDGEGRYSIVGLRPGRTQSPLRWRGSVRRARRHRAHIGLHGQRECRSESRHAAGVDHGDRRFADRRYAGDHAAPHHDARCARHDADGAQHPGGWHHDPRHQSLARRGRRPRRATSAARGRLQQSPLQFRGSGDTVQTIEGLRLNNLCAQGSYSGVYWNDASFEEISYVTGADSTEMGQGGMRVNMVPRDGGNQFHGQFFGNWASESFTVGQLRLARRRVAVHAVEPEGQHDVQPRQRAEQRRRSAEDLGHQPVHRRADQARQALVPLHIPALGHHRTKADAYADRNPSPYIYER